MEWFERVKEEIFSGKVSNSDIQDRKAFNYLWNLSDFIQHFLFLEFGREFAEKITLWQRQGFLEFSFGWRRLEPGKRRASISQIPRYSLMVFSDGTLSISLNNFFNKLATKQFVRSLKEVSDRKFFREQLRAFLESYREAFLEIEDISGKRTYQLVEFKSEEDFIATLTGIQPSMEKPLKGGYVNLWFSTVEEDVFSFAEKEVCEFVKLTKPLYVAFYLPVAEVEPRRRTRNLLERRNWEKVKRELLKLERRCQLCGAENPLEVAHVIPYSWGGPDSPENLLVLCSNCHRRMVPTAPIGVKKIRGRFWISFTDKSSGALEVKPLRFCNHCLKENEFWRKDGEQGNFA